MGRALKGITTEQRFWRFVNKSAGPDGCWLWTGSTVTSGYGQFFARNDEGANKHVRAHRHSFAMANGPIPDGSLVRHSCDDRRCVNPLHLSLGSHWDNGHDAAIRGRSFIKWLSDDTVAQIKELLAEGKRQSDIARQFSITRYAVWNIAHGKRHKEANNTQPENDKSATSSSKEQSRAS